MFQVMVGGSSAKIQRPQPSRSRTRVLEPATQKCNASFEVNSSLLSGSHPALSRLSAPNSAQPAPRSPPQPPQHTH